MDISAPATSIIQVGAVGGVLLLALYALYKKDKEVSSIYKEYNLLQEKRILDLKEFRDKLTPLLKKIQEQNDIIYKKINGKHDKS